MSLKALILHFLLCSCWPTDHRGFLARILWWQIQKSHCICHPDGVSTYPSSMPTEVQSCSSH